MALLVSTMDTAEERLFYLTQTGMLAGLGCGVTAMADRRTPAREGRHSDLRVALTLVLTALDRATHCSLREIDPRSRRRASTSTRSAGPSAWPPSPSPSRPALGPSGTSSPIFNALDMFLGRERFESALGPRNALRCAAATRPTGATS